MKTLITQFVKKQKINRKISLIFLPPLVVIMIGILMVIGARFSDINQANSAQEAVQLATILDDIAHNHAVERGLTAGFLGSKGASGRDKLGAQRVKADAAKERFTTYLAAHENDNLPNVAEQLNVISYQLSQIPGLRSQVDKLDASGNPFKVYSDLNRAALNTISLLNASISNPEISGQLDTLINILWLKERAGQERGALNGVFASSRFNISKLLSIDAYISDQNTRLEALSRVMSKQDYNNLESRISDEANTNVIRYREIFYNAAENNGALNEDANNWFEQSTARIKNIKGVADDISASVIDAASAMKSKAWATATLTGLLALAGAIGLFLFTRIISNELRNNIQTLVGSLTTIKQDKDFSKRVELDTEDELADAASATNALLEELQRAINSVNKVMGAIAKGQFESRIVEEFNGDLGQLKQSVNGSAEKVQLTMQALDSIMDALDQGDFSARMHDDVEGDLKGKVDNSMATLDAALGAVGDIFSKMSEGEFSQRIDMPLKGSLNQLKVNINHSLDGIESAMGEISQVVTKQKSGEFSARIQGEYRGQLNVLKEAINESMSSINFALNDITKLFGFMRDGDYSQSLDREMHGDLNDLKQLINTSMAELNAAITEISSVASAQQLGQLDARINGKYQGQLAALKDSLNTSGSSLNEAMSAISKVMSEVAQGNFSDRVTINMNGVFNELKNTMTSSLDALQGAITSLNDVASAQNNGELHKRMEGNHHGELANIQEAVNASMHNLSGIVKNVQDSSRKAADLTEEQLSSASDLSRRTESQAAALEEIASTMEHIQESAAQTETGCTQISEHITQAREVSSRSLETVDSTVSSMNEMRDSSQRIATITSMIDEIAFQTNLLALNAAVEAARAGEQGRGFAVVATEVRSLAQRSGEAARNIKGLIEENVAKVDESFGLAQQSKQSLTEIVEAVTGSGEITQQVAEMAVKQNISVREVKQAITDLDTMTQQNAAMVEETSAANRSVADQSAKVSSLLNYFVLDSDAG